MDWKTLPGFEEKFARITIKPHNTFGGKVVEVLYGAQDENGNPVQPKEVGVDGCGRWYGVDNDGETTMYVWTHPACDGGNTEYGTEFGENAVEAMENDVRAKLALCRKAEDILKSSGNTEEQIAELRAEWDAMKDWGTAKEKEYAERLENSLSSFNAKVERFKANAEDKAKLVAEAVELASSTEWKKTQEAFRTLQDEWQEIGSAGDADDELWGKFSAARKQFNDARRAYFDNLDEMRAKAGETKKQLIEEAGNVLAGVKNWKQAGEKMNALMDSWKAAGSSGRETDDELWAQFNGIRKEFFEKRRAFFDERNELRKQAVDAKKALIAKAQEIVDQKNFSKEITEQMKNLDKEWKAAGNAGREENDKLWDAFKAVKEVFWNAKHEDSLNRFREIIDRKQNSIKTIRAEVERLGEQEYETSDYTKIRGIQSRIEEKKAVIEKLQEEIKDLEAKIAE